MPQKSKQELISEGYKNEMFKLSDRIDTLDNVFFKTVNDTVVKYVFNDDDLQRIEVGFSVKNMDTASFFKEVRKRGFVKADPVEAGAQMAFSEPTQKIHYDVYLGKKYVSFAHFFKKPGYSPPTADSVGAAK